MIEKHFKQAVNIVIATDSVHVFLKGVEVDEKNIFSSTGALNYDNIKISDNNGGGYIGLRWDLCGPG